MAKCIHCQTNIMIPARHRGRAQFCYICGNAFKTVNGAPVNRFESALASDGSQMVEAEPARKMPKRATLGFKTKMANAFIAGIGSGGICLAFGGSAALAAVWACAPAVCIAFQDQIIDAADMIIGWKRSNPVVEQVVPEVLRIETENRETGQITIDYAEQRVAQHLVKVAKVVIAAPLGKGLEFKRATVGQGSYNAVTPWLLENHWAVLRGTNIRGGVALTPRCYKMLEGMLRNSLDSPALPQPNRL